MMYRVRNLQTVGGAPLRFLGFTLEPGFTSPPVDIQPGTTLDDLIETWVADGIAMVVPADDVGTTGAIHKKARPAAVLNLEQAKEISMRRRTSLNADVPLPEAPAAHSFRTPGAGSALKTRVLSASDIKGVGRPTPLKDIPEEARMLPRPEAAEIEKEAEVNAGFEDDGEIDEAGLEDKNAAERAIRLPRVEESLTANGKKALLAKAGAIGLDLNPAMLKSEIVQAIAVYVVNSVSEEDEAEFLQSI